jgi:hypothetical protein
MEPKTERELERGAAADLWRHTLSRIPSLFGRLVYLASLRDSNTGTYDHHGLSRVFSPDEANRTLRDSHNRVFAEWLKCGLEQQKSDLDSYFTGMATPKADLVAKWMRLKPYLNFLPARSSVVERKLYVSDVEVLLQILKSEYGAGDPE